MFTEVFKTIPMIPAGPTKTPITVSKGTLYSPCIKKCIKNPKTSFLHLTLKKEWFDLIASGEKKEEYRKIKPYWISRLLDCNYPEEERGGNKTIPYNIHYDIIENGYAPDVVLKAYHCSYKKFDIVVFRNGYSKDSPVIYCSLEGIKIGTGNPKWGAEPSKDYFIIKLGKLL